MASYTRNKISNNLIDLFILALKSMESIDLVFQSISQRSPNSDDILMHLNRMSDDLNKFNIAKYSSISGTSIISHMYFNQVNCLNMCNIIYRFADFDNKLIGKLFFNWQTREHWNRTC